jgi:hypothetical protein
LGRGSKRDKNSAQILSFPHIDVHFIISTKEYWVERSIARVEEVYHWETAAEDIARRLQGVKEHPMMAVILIALMLLAAICLIILLARRKKAMIRTLQKRGRRLIAIVTAVEQVREERGNPEIPRIDYAYYIEAEWTDPQTGNTYQFRSDRLASSPKEYSPGTFISVLIDPEQPTHYVLELPEYDLPA